MRALGLVALALVAAGCASLPTKTAPSAAADAWALDCAHVTAGWTQRCLAKVSDSPRTKAETWIAVSPVDPKIVVAGVKDMDPAKSNACVWVSYYSSTDGGTTWIDITPNGKYAARAPTDPSFGWACNTDPMQVFTKDGTLHVIVELYAEGKSVNTQLSLGTRFLMYSSKDAGKTWSAASTMMAGDGFALGPDYTRLVASPKTGTMVTTFIDFTAGKRCYVVATRAGDASDPPLVIPAPDSIGCQIAAALPDGTFVVGGINAPGADGKATTFLATSTDDAKSFGAPANGFTFSPAQGTFPGHQAYTGTGLDLVAGADGTLYAVANEKTNDSFLVTVRASHDKGRTWSAPTVAGTDAGLAQLAEAGDGTLHAFFLSSKYDTGAAPKLGVTHAWSSDRGASWREERVSDALFDPDLGRHQDGGVWFGDYVGVACAAKDCYAAFPDSSLGGEPVLTVAHVHRT